MIFFILLLSRLDKLCSGEKYAWLEPAGRGVEVTNKVDFGFNSPILEEKKGNYKECEVKMRFAKDVSKGETTKGSNGTCPSLLIGAIYHGVAQRIGQ